MSFIDGSVYKAYNSDAVLINLSATTASFWQIIIPKMRIGSKWRIWVPYNYAFGSSGYNKHSNGSYDIDPYTVLIYDIELVDAY
jgi:FKBP-type peptidyl-prolyl cis-trans isomerase